MKEKLDWYPRTIEGERGLYENSEAKIDGYAAKCAFLDVA